MKHTVAVLVLASGLCLSAAAQAAKPIAPPAPFAPTADMIAAQWSKMFKQHMTKDSALKNTCPFPSAATVGVKAYPGSRVINMHAGGGSVSNSEDVPMVELVTKAPLSKVIAWYKQHYPKMKAKRIFETAGPGLNYETRDHAQYSHHPSDVAVVWQASRFGGCGGLLEAPDAYRTGVRIYYQPHGH